MPLPSGKWLGLVHVEFRGPEPEIICIVTMPTSSGFLGSDLGSAARDRFDIFELDKAAVDYQANVTLANGNLLSATELIPPTLPLKPTLLEWRIVRYTIEFIGQTEGCYRSLADHVPSEIRDQVPDTRFLDCSKLRGLRIPSRDSIQAYVAERDPTLKRLSRQKISDALLNFGLAQTRQRAR